MTSKSLICGLALWLCTSAATAETYHISHCLAGCPSGSSDNNDTVVREIYAASVNHDTRLADWVAYKVTAGSIGVATHLPRNWVKDPMLPEALDEAEAARFAEAGFTMGSLAPLNSFAATQHWRDTTLFSNLAPQKQALRLGPWFRLEQAERTLAAQLQEPLYVVSGPVYEDDRTAPSGFYKVVALASGSVAAFLFPQDLPQHAPHCAQATTLQAVESVAGLDLFPKAPADWAQESLIERLGCL